MDRMRLSLSLLTIVPAMLLGGTLHDNGQRFRPTTYIVTLAQESQPGTIHDPKLRVWPDAPIYPGLSRVQLTVWFDNWKWREADRWLIPPPAGYSTLARFTTSPLPSTSASDGHRIWTYDPTQRTVTVYPFDPAGTWPASEGFLKGFTQKDSFEAILHSGFRCRTGIDRGTGEIAGRSVRIIEMTQDRCGHPGRGSLQRSRLLDGRTILWIDADTFFTLRADQYAYDQPHWLLMRTYVTSIKYDVPVNGALFRLTVPPGYRLIHGR